MTFLDDPLRTFPSFGFGRERSVGRGVRGVDPRPARRALEVRRFAEGKVVRESIRIPAGGSRSLQPVRTGQKRFTDAV